MRARFLALSVGAITLGFGCCLALAADPLESWAYRHLGRGEWVRDVAFGGDRFVAVGAAFYDSMDGVCWERRPLDNPTMNNGLWGVAYGNGRFVAVESGRAFTESRVFVSTTGTTWQLSAMMPAGQLPVIDRVYFGGGTFLAVGEEANPSTTPGYHWLLMTSPDGFNWVRHSGPTNTAKSSYLTAATYGNGLYVLGGMSQQGLILTSTNLEDWVPSSGLAFSTIAGLTYGKGQFVAVGYSSTAAQHQIATSADGIHWINQAAGVDQTFHAVTFGGDSFVAVGEGLILSSTNGVNWAQHPVNVDTIPGVTYGRDSFVAVGGYYTAIPIAAALQSGGKPQMCLEALGWSGSSFDPYFTVRVSARASFRLQYSPLLIDASWTDLHTNSSGGGYYSVYDSTAPVTGQRFYRLVPP